MNLSPAASAFACPRCRRDHAGIARELDAGDFVVCSTCYQVSEVEPRGGLKALAARALDDVPPELRPAILSEKRGIERRRGGS